MFPYLVGVLLALGWLGLAAWRKRMAAHWPVAEGTIEDARLKEINGLNRSVTVLVIRYSYQVNGGFYGGSQQVGFTPGSPYSYLVGTKVPVRYKPGQPETSRLLSLPFEMSSAG